MKRVGRYFTGKVWGVGWLRKIEPAICAKKSGKQGDQVLEPIARKTSLPQLMNLGLVHSCDWQVQYRIIRRLSWRAGYRFCPFHYHCSRRVRLQLHIADEKLYGGRRAGGYCHLQLDKKEALARIVRSNDHQRLMLGKFEIEPVDEM